MNTAETDMRLAALERAYTQVGQLAKKIHWLSILAADIDDREFSELCHALNRIVFFAGDRCLHLFRDDQ